MDLDDRTALVTGGGAGIGAACARELAAAGAVVHVVDRDGESARAVAAEIGGHAHVTDLAVADQLHGLPREVDVLVNNAGMQHIAPVHEFDPDTFVRMQQVMVTAPFLLARHCLPHMYRRGWGRVVNISSVHGLRASTGKSAYVAAKHGLEGLSKTIALEGAAHGVTSNCVNPGYVDTALVRDQIADQAAAHGTDPADVVERVLLTRPAIKRLIEPREVAAAVRWLCGPHSGYVSGASLALDGAWSSS
ncbi:SDR family NAD(P)-dependent oxidoreductase [Saccharopolyspora erythraea]|uniref:SDR family NAD(P)-dependent oxidoreductase n=1 Tax=Saccharopolyspora erythraea TaxID=1836 RepID=UPI001BAC0BE0|nr:SDR family NAD(P)-dependent oxidoreductase [Saccharopolyspora erythraea]QUH02848.1 SDR family NAD(P)-dependent oxidoreductase [Saccharopolyspora erythraea]